MVIIISTLLVLLSSLLTLAQPQTIPLTLEWQYDFGDLAYNSIVCDPDEDGIPDVFCRLIGNTLVRLSDGNEIWRTDDLGYSISTMSILDTNGDGVMSLVTAPDPDNYDNIVREYNIETGDLIAESPVLDTRQIYSLNSYTDSTDSTVYIVAGTGGSEVRDLLVFWVHYTQGNVIRLCPDDLTIIDSLHYAVEDSERYAELHTYYSSESNNEMIFYRQYGSEYIWGMSGEVDKTWINIGVIDNDFQRISNLQIVDSFWETGFSYDYEFHGAKPTNYIANGNNTAVVSYLGGYLEPFGEKTKLYSLPDLDLIWEVVEPDSNYFGVDMADFTGDGIDEIVNYNMSCFYVRDIETGNIIAVSEEIPWTTGTSLAFHFINTPTSLFFYKLHNGVVYCYSMNYVGVEPVQNSYQPVDFKINCISPNPFNATTIISFDLPVSGEVSLKVYSITGREAVSLIEGECEAGNHSVTWNAEGMASGVYLVRLELVSTAESRHHSCAGKVVLLK